VNSGDAVDAYACCADRRKNSEGVLLISQTNKTAYRYFQTCKQRGTFLADVCRDRVFSLSGFALIVQHFELHIHRYVMSGKNSLISRRNWSKRFFGNGYGLNGGIGDLISLPRLRLITCWWTLSDESDTDLESGRLVINRCNGLYMPYQDPNPVLVFDVIKDTQLARHRDRQGGKAASFVGPIECEASSERGYINQPCYLHPLEITRLATPYADG